MTGPTEPPGLVCLGASAGGLRSLEAIVGGLPPDFPWPILVSQHLQQDRVSMLPDILARATRLRVREAVDGETPEPGTVHTCPGPSEMGLTPEGRILLRPPSSGRPQRIDHLFSTAAFARPHRVVAVVLSGTGSDGAVGSLVVKLSGGTVVTESGASAEHSAMPTAAQRAGTVDATLDVAAIPALLVELAQGRMGEATASAEQAIQRVAARLTAATGTDFTRYRIGTMRRRIDHRRALRGDATIAEYEKRLDEPQEVRALLRSLLIPVTSFFRDPAAWAVLEQHVVPALAERARDGSPVRVWCAGSASGEEAYTVAILLAENLVDRGGTEILATDLDGDAMAAGAEGRYDASRMHGVDATRRERFFEATDHGYRVRDGLREMVRFRVHDLTREPPPGEFDLIVCRNVLIYFNEDLQSTLLDAFHEALAPGGALLLGRSEAALGHPDAFAPIVRPMRLFRAIGKAAGPPAEGMVRLAGDPDPRQDDAETREDAARRARIEAQDAVVLSLDAAWRTTAANARARDLLGPDLIGRRLLDLFPDWQGSPVHDALRAALAGGRSLKVRGSPTPWGPYDVTLEPLPGDARGLLLVGSPAPALPALDGEAHDAREDLAATTEELQSANEELAATNEELQAANEELAALNEEFQSSNQELGSTNAELHALASSARPTADLLREVLQARAEALIVCDEARRVTLHTRAAAKLFGLDGSCVGRALVEAPLGASPGDLERWLDEARSGPHEADVALPQGAYRVRVEHLASRGRPLGWALTWTPRA